ncbi:MAG: lipocalin-like domain-containing protein [Bacteroidota bacterium]|nr:lipocalin-like domain-containing protein [Bacteroidota bacterium]
MKKIYLTSLLVVLSLAIVVSYMLSTGKVNNKIKASVLLRSVLADEDTSGYERAIAPKKLVFPKDHGPHPEFKTEWWYFTGNLDTKYGRHFGYQFTIFRISLAKKSLAKQSFDTSTPSPWRTNQIYMGHFTITDVKNNKFYCFERFSRGSENLAGASSLPFKVWLEDWNVEAYSNDAINGIPELRLLAKEGDISARLSLKSLKNPVLQGDRGLSQKGEGKGNASYYYSLPRMKTEGTISIADEEFSLNGLSWMDREWSTSALDKNQSGWDWFSLQLNDGREIMYYQMRRSDGSKDRYSNGIIISPDGKVTKLNKDEVELHVLSYWTSPRDKAQYPSTWRLKIPKGNIDLQIVPYVKDQQLNVSIHYWEGAVRFWSNSSDKTLSGNGYVELTGYEKILADEKENTGLTRRF